ncbi:MAG: hypothetical protein QNJ47_23600 [Nostocaceae cyanobacterium]|nr:hypothetical protein [Nostocaceae cyanobacterium]
MNNVSELVINYLQRYGCQISEDYKTFLREACEIYPPPHGMAWYGNYYRQFARKPEWFANSLMANAAEEGNGSRKVWQFSRCIQDSECAKLVRSHSIDESRHSKMFVALLNILFPTQLSADFRSQLQALSPNYYHHKHPTTEPINRDSILDTKMVMDEIIKINLLEIRALILQLLLRPVLQAYATPKDLAKVTTMSDLFIYDETKHVEYSAYCIGKYIQQGNQEWVREMMIYRQQTVNEMFLTDVELENSLGTTVLNIDN